MQAVDWSSYKHVVVLTGAGVSVASGLRPYRGVGGLWEEIDVLAVADAGAVKERPAEVWHFFAEARQAVRSAAPNPAHQALARLEQRLTGGASFTLITQNVDGLHQRAGNRNVVEIHGSLARTRCSDPGCSLVGTSGTVSPASNFVRSAEYVGARTILVNLEPMLQPNPAFQEELLGKAEELLPKLVG
jgi:NAD-dependent deacetylase